MIHWAWLIPAFIVGAGLGFYGFVAVVQFVGSLGEGKEEVR